MYILNITDDYDSFTNNTKIIDGENDKIIIFIKLLLLSIPSGLLLLTLIRLFIWTILKPLLTNKKWTNFYNHLIQFAVSLQGLLNVEKK